MYKNCKQCGTEFAKKQTTSTKNWNERVKYCSRKCKDDSQKGKPTWNAGTKGVMKPNQTSFKNGHDKGKRFKKGNVPHNAGTATVYKGNCKQCDEEFKASSRKLGHEKAENKKFCSKECQYIFNRGENNPNWRGGLATIQETIRKSHIYVKWRKQILKERHFTCEECGQLGGRLEVHHIKAFSEILNENKIETIEEAKRCIELWDKENTQCLCKPCHKETDNYCSKQLIKNNKNPN